MDIAERTQRPVGCLVAVLQDVGGGAERAGYVQHGEEEAKGDLTAGC